MSSNVILIDGWALGMQGVGVGSFATRLIRALAVRRSELPGPLVVILPRYLQKNIDASLSRLLPLKFIWCPKTLRPILDQAIWNQRLGAFAKRKNAILICPAPFWAILAPRRTMVCHHDRVYHHWPIYLARSRFRRWLVNRSEGFLARCSRIITGSYYSRAELLEIGGVEREKIEVIYHWLPDDYNERQASRDAARVRSKYKLPDAYWLYMGGYDLRKNLFLLLSSYAGLKNLHPPPLVLAGKMPTPAPYNCDIDGMMRDLNLNCDEVLRPGMIDAGDIPGLFGGASLMIYPSLHEGFGLPPMEAMGCGCPAICGDNTSLREVVKDATYRFGTGSTNDLSTMLARHLREPFPLNPSFRREQFDPDSAIGRFISEIKCLSES